MGRIPTDREGGSVADNHYQPCTRQRTAVVKPPPEIPLYHSHVCSNRRAFNSVAVTSVAKRQVARKGTRETRNPRPGSVVIDRGKTTRKETVLGRMHQHDLVRVFVVKNRPCNFGNVPLC
jgi:hypothetical protein